MYILYYIILYIQVLLNAHKCTTGATYVTYSAATMDTLALRHGWTPQVPQLNVKNDAEGTYTRAALARIETFTRRAQVGLHLFTWKVRSKAFLGQQYATLSTSFDCSQR